jgi:hypothetical protein
VRAEVHTLGELDTAEHGVMGNAQSGYSSPFSPDLSSCCASRNEEQMKCAPVEGAR